MKVAQVLTQVREAIAHLNPHEVREEANRPFTLELFAASPEAYDVMERFFTPADKMTPARREEAAGILRRGSGAGAGTVLRVVDAGAAHSSDDFIFLRAQPELVVRDIIDRHPELRLSLAAKVCPFREPVVRDVLVQISKENALFSLATAIPDAIPFFALPWAVGEFASDTAFLTANQIRMAFMLAAASNRTIGYRQQKAEIASLFAGSFGWRALAREMVGKVPFGGGLIPKAAIAFAGTYVVGASLERYYRVGYGYTPAERKAVYREMLQQGKEVAASLVRRYAPGKS